MCFNGIPDDSYAFRSLCWKLLLGYLPENQAKWKSTLQGKRECYQQLLDEMITPPGEIEKNQCIDHPLSEGPESNWSNYFKDNEVLLQIDKDVRRLCPDISFFQQVKSIFKGLRLSKRNFCFDFISRLSTRVR